MREYRLLVPSSITFSCISVGALTKGLQCDFGSVQWRHVPQTRQKLERASPLLKRPCPSFQSVRQGGAIIGKLEEERLAVIMIKAAVYRVQELQTSVL